MKDQNYDVVVVGGGVSGSMAAIAASRQGAKTLLIEQHPFLGGSLTAMGVGPMMSFHNRGGEQLIQGLPEELIQRLIRKGASPGHVVDSTSYCSTVTPFKSEYLKMELELMLEEAGGEVLYHTQLADVVKEGANIREILVCNKSGLGRIRGAQYIDATGDADLALRSGVPMQEASSGRQPMTMNLKIAQVDTERMRQYILDNPGEFQFEHGAEIGLERVRTAPKISISGFFSLWRKAKSEGRVEVPRDDVLLFQTAAEGEVIVNTSRIQGLDPTDPFELSRAEIIGRRQCLQIFDFLKNDVPGFENAIRVDAAAQVGVRESRNIIGEYLLTEEDLMSGRNFPDTIALGGYPVDLHSSGEGDTVSRHPDPNSAYQIPLRSLIPLDVDNLTVVGRCVSATHEAAGAIRVTPIAMAIGQAGGSVAALCVQEGKTPRRASSDRLRELLLESNAKLERQPA